MPTLIKEVRLIKTEVGENANKFWNAQLFDDGKVKASWGRVGYAGESGEWDGGEKYLDKKIKEKTKKGYSEQKTIGAVSSTSSSGGIVRNSDLHEIARTQLCKSSNSALEKLVKRFVEANVHKITANTQITYNSTTGLFATPLGVVTMDGLTDARNLLAQIAPVVRAKQFGETADSLLSKYLRIIPQNIGMKRFSMQSIIPDDNALQKQNDLIDSLESSYQAMQAPAASTGQSKAQEQVFKVDLDIMSDDKERQRLINFFERSKKSMHHYNDVRVKEIYTVCIHDMHNAFDRKLGRNQEVFHGTSQANCLSILKSGLKVSPPSTAAIAGKMFGNGVYGAINSSKSLGYTFGRWGQGGTGDAGWLFICDFAMGKTHDTYHSLSSGAPRGYDSVWAKAGQSLHNDELIVYRNNQVTIKALLECK